MKLLDKQEFYNNPLIIAAWPGSGKSWFAKHNSKFDVCDLESSYYHWDQNKITKVCSDKWPINYCNEIKKTFMNGLYEVICISLHEEVVTKLLDWALPVTFIIPEKDAKSIFKERYIRRGDDKEFIEKQMANFESRIDQVENYKTWHKPYYLSDVFFLKDVISQVHYDYLCWCNIVKEHEDN